MYTVIMERGELEPLVFTDYTERRARQRGQCLGWLHGDCPVVWRDPNTLVVHASDYYAD